MTIDEAVTQLKPKTAVVSFNAGFVSVVIFDPAGGKPKLGFDPDFVTAVQKALG